MHVHALVDVHEEGYFLRRIKRLYIDFLELTDSLDEGFVLRAFDANLYVEHLVTLFICYNCCGIHGLD